MIATVFNCALIILGGLLGILLRHHISERFTDIVIQGLGLCVLGIGLTSALQTEDTLCVILCMVLGCLLGEALGIEARLDSFGDFLKSKLPRGKSGNNRFTEGFVSASILFCVGAMAVMGAIDAGIRGDYALLISKSVIDGVMAITFAAVMGVGVLFAALPILLYQGGLTLLSSLIANHLDPAALTEMSAVGGLIIVGISFNTLNLREKKLKVGNMLPAIFLPFLYLPCATFLRGLF